jgi:pimeloyl-ACP methyl ester carboxylesterase
MKRLLLYIPLLLVLLLCILITLWWRPDLDVDYLENKYAQESSRFMNIEGVRLHYRDSGNPNLPAIVLIHGFGASLHTWEAWAQDLQKDFRVIRFDLPGFGLTGPEPMQNYSDDRVNALLIKLLDTANIQKVTMIGNSIGGRIAWYFAAKHPERTEKLVLISPDGFKSPGISYNNQPEIPWYLNSIKYIFPQFLFKQNLELAYTNPSVLTETLFERYYELALYPGNRQAMLDRMRATVLKDPQSFLKEIHCPTLLLWGDNDRMIPLSNAQDYLRLMPQASLQVLPNIGHLPQEESANMSLPFLREFLK